MVGRSNHVARFSPRELLIVSAELYDPLTLPAVSPLASGSGTPGGEQLFAKQPDKRLAGVAQVASSAWSSQNSLRSCIYLFVLWFCSEF